jgi:mRNA interferase MazF
MIVRRGEIWLADLNPIRGSEQAGTRPVLVVQNETINKFTTTALAVPFTTNLSRATLPSCVLVAQGEGGLTNDSVALCHHLRAIDRSRLSRKLGTVSQPVIAEVEKCLLFTMGLA